MALSRFQCVLIFLLLISFALTFFRLFDGFRILRRKTNPMSTKLPSIWTVSFTEPPVLLPRPTMKTTVPMYYINLDQSVGRRRIMQTMFGSSGNLTRVPAFSAESIVKHLEKLKRNIPYKTYRRLARGTDGEIALFASHLLAVQTAYNDGCTVALIMEDDLSDLLLPFWTRSLDQTVEALPNDWHLARLQYGAAGGDVWWLMSKWRQNDDTFYYRTSDFLPGCGAYLIHRRGMKQLLSTFTDENGIFDCLRRPVDLKCVADKLLMMTPDLVHYLVFPPMFTPRLFDPPTGTRGDAHLNGHWLMEQQFVADAFNWVYEAYERFIVSLSGHTTPFINPSRPSRVAVSQAYV